jgi:hypothetical protein
MRQLDSPAHAVTPERILQFAWAFAPPLVIEAAVRNGVFDAAAKRPPTLPELAQASGASGRGVAAIAGVLVGLGLPSRDAAGRYALACR